MVLFLMIRLILQCNSNEMNGNAYHYIKKDYMCKPEIDIKLLVIQFKVQYTGLLHGF